MTAFNQPIVTAEKYIAYKKANDHIENFSVPHTVLICYQKSSMNFLLTNGHQLTAVASFPGLYLLKNTGVGVLGEWGFGAPALAVKIEQLIVLGVKQFVAVGTAGTLLNSHKVGDFILAPQALAEDGVAHLYLKSSSFSQADTTLISHWELFSNKHKLPQFNCSSTWSFSAIYRETLGDILRVFQQGCEVVEMEAATLYAIGQDKNIATLSLFVVSDVITEDSWTPHIKEPAVRENLHQLVDWALQFCKEVSIASPVTA